MKLKLKHILPHIVLIILILFLVYYLYNNRTEGFQTQDTMKQYSVVFGGTVRNVEQFIKKNLEHIDNCGKKFKDYAVVLYENDSSDKTRKILEDNKKDNYHYIFDTTNEPSRTKRLAHGRNQILNKVRELNNYDFLIMLDLDDVNNSGKFVESIDSCFINHDWDVLTGNQSGDYYDIWAFRKRGLLDWDCWREHARAIKNGMSGSEASDKYVWGIIKKFEPGQMIEVESAFSGIAIYRLETLPDNCSYKGYYDDDGSEICEHVPFHECLKNNGLKIFVNTNFLTN
jgi:hypothetical protein